MQLFLSKGGCQSCHGWAGDGRKTDNQMPDGANLRETLLDRDIIVMTIKCGRPGRHMPAYDRLAYSDGRCYGMKQADLKNNPPARSAGDAATTRDRTHHGFFVCEGDQAGAHDPCEVHRVLGKRVGGLQRVQAVNNIKTSATDYTDLRGLTTE